MSEDLEERAELLFLEMFKQAFATPLWQKKAGKNPKGGLNAAGRKSALAQGMHLRPPVLVAKTLAQKKRQRSFLARMSGMPGPDYDEKGRPTRKLLSLRVWGASSSAHAKRKAARLGEEIKRAEERQKSNG